MMAVEAVENAVVFVPAEVWPAPEVIVEAGAEDAEVALGQHRGSECGSRPKPALPG